METMHRLRIIDPADWWRLSEATRLRHLAHVRNEIQGAYMSDMRPMPDMDDKGRVKRKPADAQDLMSSQLAFKHAPPSQQVIDNARMLLNVPGIHPLLRRDAEETLHRAGLTA